MCVRCRRGVEQSSLGVDAPPVESMYEPTDGLLPPSQRRQQMAVLTQRLIANKARKTVLTESIRQRELMLRRHPHGLVGVDSPAFVESPVYGALAAEAQERAEKQRAHAEARCVGCPCVVV